ncbi:hypothetical protein STRATTON_258 [Erwinia phage vB_EamM_Stratton]|uniref:Uncharacterized protein n=1 Tax=Erwinia phage vB_EamM_Stratton TaxID=1883378 RepID=A0A1B2IHH2_9CAUD|nr:hypothetical protein STRATTON_258 [Erwinia phage vB_EamM_Stratton]
MEKRLHTFDYNGREQLFVNGELWEDHGLTLQQLWKLKLLSSRHGGLEFVFTDQPIPEQLWTDQRDLLFWEVRESFLKKVLYTHSWRGGCHSPANVLKLSERYGTEMAYIQTWPKELDENSLVVWWSAPQGSDRATVRIVFEHDYK